MVRKLLVVPAVVFVALIAAPGIGQDKPIYKTWEETGVSLATSSIKGYAGMYVDSAQNLHIWVKDVGRTNGLSLQSQEGRASLVRRLETAFGTRLGRLDANGMTQLFTAGDSVTIEPAQRSFDQLSALKSQLLILSTDDTAIAGAGIDERTNSVFVDVGSKSALQALKKAAQSKGISDDGYTIRVTGPVRRLGGTPPPPPTTTLEGIVRPVQGGTRIRINTGVSTFEGLKIKLCSFGFFANSVTNNSTTLGFVTSLHCSAPEFVNQSFEQVGQPVDGVNNIGVVAKKAPILVPGNSGCPNAVNNAYNRCFTSDAMFVALNGAASQPGAIASLSTNGNATEAFNPAAPIRYGQAAQLPTGKLVYSVGATTGRSAGTVTTNTYTTPRPSPFPPTIFGFEWKIEGGQVAYNMYQDDLTCVSISSGAPAAGAGDSGGPVYEGVVSSGSLPNILGIMSTSYFGEGNNAPGYCLDKAQPILDRLGLTLAN